MSINNNSVVGYISTQKHCSVIKITNYKECSIDFLDYIAKMAFVINTTDDENNLICVIPGDNLDEFVYHFVRNTEFCLIPA